MGLPACLPACVVAGYLRQAGLEESSSLLLSAYLEERREQSLPDTTQVRLTHSLTPMQLRQHRWLDRQGSAVRACIDRLVRALSCCCLCCLCLVVLVAGAGASPWAGAGPGSSAPPQRGGRGRPATARGALLPLLLRAAAAAAGRHLGLAAQGHGCRQGRRAGHRAGTAAMPSRPHRLASDGPWACVDVCGA